MITEVKYTEYRNGNPITESFFPGMTLPGYEDKIEKINFIKDEAGSPDYGIKIETEKGTKIIIPNPTMITISED
jgi:hypothetical protein